MNAEHPTQVPSSGVALSPAETDRLHTVLGSAGRTLAAADDQPPVEQRLCQQLDRAADDLTRRLLRAERASVRLDTPVRLDVGERAQILGLLEQAATRLEQEADRREAQAYLVGPDHFRAQANAARAWHADLAALAARQTQRDQPQRQANAERTPAPEAAREHAR